MWLKYGLKAQKLQKQHALKAQKLLAQGSALGIMTISKTPCKGKSFQIPGKNFQIPGKNFQIPGNIQSFCPYNTNLP